MGALQAETRDILAGMQTFLSRFPHASNKKSGWGVKINSSHTGVDVWSGGRPGGLSQFGLGKAFKLSAVSDRPIPFDLFHNTSLILAPVRRHEAF